MKNNSVDITLLAELIGQDKAITFIQCFGGRDYSFPVNNDNKQANRLKQVVGTQEAIILIRHFTGEKCYIKIGKDYQTNIRNKKFLDEFYTLTDGGMAKTIAMHILCPKYGFTKRWGDEIVSRYEQSQGLRNKKNLENNAKKTV